MGIKVLLTITCSWIIFGVIGIPLLPDKYWYVWGTTVMGTTIASAVYRRENDV
jgi:hypothetical protein